MGLDYRTMEIILEVLLVITAVVTTAFSGIYATRPWYTTAEGRGVFLFSISIAILILETVWFRWWPPTNIDVMFALQFVGMAFAALASIYMSVVLVRGNVTHVAGPRPQPEQPPEGTRPSGPPASGD